MLVCPSDIVSYHAAAMELARLRRPMIISTYGLRWTPQWKAFFAARKSKTRVLIGQGENNEAFVVNLPKVEFRTHPYAHAKYIICGPLVLLGSRNMTGSLIEEPGTNECVCFESKKHATSITRRFERLWVKADIAEELTIIL